MNVVGRVGSLISQGVYSVATPFHPFGGAVDIIVVEQQDGTYRSTPWYVRFGKFQGVLKGAEKIVTIAVNGVEANFHMYLDNSGEAYFMREVTAESKDDESSDQVRDESGTHEANQGEEVCNNEDDRDNLYDKSSEETLNDEFSFQNEQSCKDNSDGSAEYNAYHYGSLEEVEAEPSENVDSEMVLVSVDGHVLTAPISSNEQGTDNVKLTTPQFHLGPGKSSGEDFCGGEGTWEFGDIRVSESNDTTTSALQSDGSKDVGGVPMNDQESQHIECSNMGSNTDDMVAMMKRNDMFKSCLDLVSHNEEGDSQGEGSLSVQLEQSRVTFRVNDIALEGTTAQGSTNLTDIVPLPIEGSPCNGELQSASIGIEVYETTVSVGFERNTNLFEGDVSSMKSDQPCCEGPPDTNIGTKASENKSSSTENIDDIGSGDFPVCSVNEDLEKKDLEILDTVNECSETEISVSEKALFGLGVDISLCGHLLCRGMGRNSAEEAFEAHCISEEEFKASGATIIKDAKLIIRFKEKYFLWDKAAHIVLGMAVFGPQFPLELKDAIPVEHDEISKAREDAPGVSPTSSRRWRLWPIPFRRTRSLQHSNSSSSNEDLFVDTESVFQSPHAEQGLSDNNNQSPRKQFLRTKIPTNEQIASLDLKDGQNLITFSFSTRVLGRQQVDAHIYLWKWNARIVISDVDGTITKSDVLGQFMPLVGKDWTQSGVARLFSAIKENGYQLLFLSARAIVQAYLTRSFLLNLKQDGKALPSGPVVISPDGLFPSLYREVIRRAPHEFKIACLEDIRALFPSDYNPFYAGFGNRDTDELSYRKIGIPKGKIFIINPKGEVAINHCIDVKSYTSLHTLVNDMFPPTSLVEQEDYNTWNYWKVPLPNIDC